MRHLTILLFASLLQLGCEPTAKVSPDDGLSGVDCIIEIIPGAGDLAMQVGWLSTTTNPTLSVDLRAMDKDWYVDGKKLPRSKKKTIKFSDLDKDDPGKAKVTMDGSDITPKDRDLSQADYVEAFIVPYAVSSSSFELHVHYKEVRVELLFEDAP